MHEEFEERVRRALSAEVQGLPLAITPAMVEERLSQRSGPRWAGVSAVVASSAVLAIVLGIGIPALTAVESTSPAAVPTTSQWPKVTELPVGYWVAGAPFRSGSLCVAIRVEESDSSTHTAWWWHPVDGPDCTSTGSSPQSTTAHTQEFPLVRIATPPMADGSRELSLRLLGTGPDELNLDGVTFYRVVDFDPAEGPPPKP